MRWPKSASAGSPCSSTRSISRTCARPTSIRWCGRAQDREAIPSPTHGRLSPGVLSILVSAPNSSSCLLQIERHLVDLPGELERLAGWPPRFQSVREGWPAMLEEMKKSQEPPLCRRLDFNPHRSVVARALLSAYPLVDARGAQERAELAIEQQMVDPQARITRPVVTEEIPKAVDALLRMQRADRVRPALREQSLVGGAAGRLQQCVLLERAGVVDVEVGRQHIVVAGEHHGLVGRGKRLRMLDQALEPGELVVELRARLRVAIRKVETGDADTANARLQETAMRVVRITGQPAPDFDRRAAPRQDRDSIEGRLTMPHRFVAGCAQRQRREALAGRFELLQTGDVRSFPLQPLDQAREATADAVDVVGCDLHG